MESSIFFCFCKEKVFLSPSWGKYAHSSEFVSSIMEEPVVPAILSSLQSKEIMCDNEIDALDKIGDEVSSAAVQAGHRGRRSEEGRKGERGWREDPPVLP